MEVILNKIIESLINGNILVAISILAIAFLFNIQKLFAFYDDRKKARIITLIEALNNEDISGLTREHLKDELETEQFKLSTGIRLEKKFREALIRAHKNTNGELSFRHYKRALPHIKYRSGEVVVNVTGVERGIYWFNSVFGVLMIFCGLFLLIVPSQTSVFNLFQLFSILSVGVAFLAMAVFMLFQTFPIYSAKWVSKELEKTHNKSNQQEC